MGRSTVGSAVIGFGLSDADFVNAAGQKGTGLVWLKKCLDLGAPPGCPDVAIVLVGEYPAVFSAGERYQEHGEGEV